MVAGSADQEVPPLSLERILRLSDAALVHCCGFMPFVNDNLPQDISAFGRDAPARHPALLLLLLEHSYSLRHFTTYLENISRTIKIHHDLIIITFRKATPGSYYTVQCCVSKCAINTMFYIISDCYPYKLPVAAGWLQTMFN